MDLRTREQSEVSDPEEIYEDSPGPDVEQSAIYKGVHFSCINEEIFGIVVTPACDIYWKKAQYVKMAGILPAEQVFFAWLEKNGCTRDEIGGIVAVRSKKRFNNLHNNFAEWYIGNREIRYHFLPSYQDILPHSFVDFQLVESLYPDSTKKLEKIAVLKSRWKEAIPARYASYCGRIGTKDYSKKLVGDIINQVSDLKCPQ